MTVSELIDALGSFNPNAIVMRESKDMCSDYRLETIVIYGVDSNHVFLEFDEE